MTTYRAAGVDRDSASAHLRRIAGSVTSTWTEKVVGAFGGFAAGVQLPTGYRSPVLMMTTDGVGTKLELAKRSGRWSGVGHDLVAMCVDDLAAVGARPLGLVDYMAVGSLDPDRDAAIVESIAAACLLAGCPLLGGETAAHPGVMEPDAIDLAGAALGVVEQGEELGAHRVRPGDLVIGLLSPNLRSNGFSLVRTALADAVDEHMADLLAPSVIYSPSVLAAVGPGGLRAGAHITGGGLVENLRRVIPEEMGVVIDTSMWTPPPIFAVVAGFGISRDEMFRTFNMGIGFCLLVEPGSASSVIAATEVHSPVVLGEVTTHSGVGLR